MFETVPTKVDFPALEREILQWWKDTDAFNKLRKKLANAPRWSFIDGPITANNPMGVHHAWGRTYKDLYQRYKAMRGYNQRWQNGFDGQGLWVEVEVEKELGFTSKRDIERYGIAEFVQRCKERVLKFAAIQTQQSIRLGYWMDWDNSYHTMSDENNYTIWLFLKKCHQRGLIYRGHDVMPWCPRCGTGISEHEIATEGYQELVHRSVFLRFPLVGRSHEHLLVWTTTPWTLTSNVAAAVHPDLTYVAVKQGDDVYYLSKGALANAMRGPYQVIRTLRGSEMVGWTYQGPFDEIPPLTGVTHTIIPWEEVGEAEGTGIVHIAPGCGKEDFALGKQHNLAVIAPLDEFGVFEEGFGWLSGLTWAEAAQPIFDSLKSKGLLYRLEDYRHRYPVCWRCGTELVFRLVDEWFISMEQLRYEIMEVTKRIRWIPEFGLERELDWLRNMDDWMISKKRYWGLALPIYVCTDCGKFDVVGSEEELKERAVEGWEQFEGHSPHRPWIDAVKIRCPFCGSLAARIPDVGNPWLDAGIVPYSTLNYRHDRAYWSQWFPADFITESFPGQFRNWFYSLLTMSTVLENREPFKTCFGYALLRDEKGEEMHKSKGNAIWFDDAAERMGVDVMRWLYCGANPTQNLNFGYGLGDETRRRFILPLWNVYSFFVTYARLDKWLPGAAAQRQGFLTPSRLSLLDRWILSELQQLIVTMTERLDDYDAYAAVRAAEAFVENLSNWYVRRSRRRFWKSESDADKDAAYATLYECLVTLCKLLAPFIPFLTEAMYQNLVRRVDNTAPESVHHNDWPTPRYDLLDHEVIADMQLVLRVVGLGRAARSKANLRIRQPLANMLVKVRKPEEEVVLERVQDIVLDELNIKAMDYIREESELVSFVVKPRYNLLGPRFGKRMPAVASALSALDQNSLGRSVRAGQSITLMVEGEEVIISPDELEVRVMEREGYATAEEDGYLVGVNTTLTADLVQEGLAREVVRHVQDLRKEANFDIADRIILAYDAPDIVSQAIARFADYIKQETLAVDLRTGHLPDGVSRTVEVDDHRLTLSVRRLS
jgi:isoleucyl-tRNA synthetase